MDHQQMATAVRAKSKAKSGNQKGKSNKQASRHQEGTSNIATKLKLSFFSSRNRTTFTDEQIHILQVRFFNNFLIAVPHQEQTNLSDKKFRSNIKLFLCRRISSLTAILTVKILRGTVPLLFRIFAMILIKNFIRKWHRISICSRNSLRF